MAHVQELERADHSRASAAIDQCLCGRNGLRVEKSTGTTNGTLYWRAVTGETIAESDLTGSTTNSAYVEYIFFDGERIASRNGSSGAVNYYYTDQLGSIVTITDGNGTPCYEATFTPYGQEMPTSLSWTCSTNYKFTGYERDSETGLDYAFARYYNPRLGRFMSADPLTGDVTDPQSLNRYTYVENNPDTFMDPLGLARCVLNGTVSTAPNKRACKEGGGTWQPDPPPPGTIFPTCTGVGPCVIGPVKPSGPGGGPKPQKPSRAVCAANLADKYSIAGAVGTTGKTGFFANVFNGVAGNTFSSLTLVFNHQGNKYRLGTSIINAPSPVGFGVTAGAASSTAEFIGGEVVGKVAGGVVTFGKLGYDAVSFTAAYFSSTCRGGR